jgi:hypothetical protein
MGSKEIKYAHARIKQMIYGDKGPESRDISKR